MTKRKGIRRYAAGCALMAFVSWTAAAEPGLLFVAHGAPMSAWNKPVLEFGERAAEKIAGTGKYKAIRTAMLEFSEPSVPKMLAELEGEGCDRIVVLPLFIAPSSHTTYDLPAVLGIYKSEEMAETLKKENAEIARPNVPIILTETLSEGELLSRYVSAETAKLSKDPENEALLLLVHGDEAHHALVETIAKKAVVAACGQVHLDRGDWAFVEMGQSFAQEGAAAINGALKEKQRVLVVGLYFSSSAKSIATAGMAMAPKMKMMEPEAENPLKDERVIFSEEGIVAYEPLLDEVAKRALRALE